MKIFIVEDEKAAVKNLKVVLSEVCSNAEIVGEADSICEAQEWFESHDVPDLVFMDIHLADGISFEIFEHVNITCPIIFTTAYDEYALRAFKVNSIDYLLKPINVDDLKKAFSKINAFSNMSCSINDRTEDNIVNEIMKKLNKEENYKTHFLIPAKGDKFIPLSVDSIMYFHISDGTVKAIDSDNIQYTLSQSLDELTGVLNPKMFFRANRQFLVSKKAIKDISIWLNGRLAINLKECFSLNERIIISKAKASEFKDWF